VSESHVREQSDTNGFALEAQAEIHHALLLGMQLGVAVEYDSDTLEDWMFRLFRRQHELKFLDSFDKLGLTGLPDAVACARYHVLSNSIGGVAVEYMEENDRKAWVRFRYPRWMYAGPTICGVPVGVSRGFLRGWYAYNGVSLANARLGFVCVSEDMTGEFGFCGYFREYDEPLDEQGRLQFARDELAPPFMAEQQLSPPAEQWSEERLRKAARNYAVEFIRNGVVALKQVLGSAQTLAVVSRCARLVGLQYYAATAARIGAHDGGAEAAARYLARMLAGMGDTVTLTFGDAEEACVTQHSVRIVRGIEVPADAELLLQCWGELWRGAVRSHRAMLDLQWERKGLHTVEWRVFSRRTAGRM
jgi:hypothetical protein